MLGISVKAIFNKRAMVRLLSLGSFFTLFGATSFASSYTWDLTGSGGVGTFGNTRTFSSNGVTVKVSAWSYTYGSSNNALETAALGQWSTGLGVCDREETSSPNYDCSSPNHQVDNVGTDDWVLFLFSTSVDPYYVEIDPYGVWDRDVEYRLGNVSSSINLNGKTYADLTALGFSDWILKTNTASDNPIDIPIDGTAGYNALLFGAKRGEFSGSEQDAFKISEISAGTPVPEPSSLMLLGTGLAALAYCRRKYSK